jgi:hypothetical protein
MDFSYQYLVARSTTMPSFFTSITELTRENNLFDDLALALAVVLALE